MTRQWIQRISVITLLLFLSGCALFTRNQPPPKEIIDPLVERNRQWQEQIDKGNWALQNQEFDRAIEAYQAALAIKPEVSEPQLKIAEIYFQRQEYERARDAFAALLKLDPQNNNARNYQGYIYENLNNYEAAAQAYEGTLKIEPRNLYALNHLGLAYKQLHRLDDAERVLRKVLEIDPKCARPESKNLHNYLGAIYQEKGDIGEAIAEFRESVRLFPKDTWARQQLATIYENHERYYEAQLQYQEILAVDPQNLLAIDRLKVLGQLDSFSAGLSLSKSPAPVDISPVELVDINVDEMIAQAPGAADYPDADAIILLNQFSHDVLPTGKSRYTSHQVIKLLTERGIQKYDDLAIAYHSTAQNIAVNIAQTITPDGSRVEPPDDAFNDVTPPGLLAYNLYSDTMWKVISMPALEPGVCIEYQVTLEDAGAESIGSQTWFWGGFNFQSTDPTLRSNYALRLPKEMKFRWKTTHCQLDPQILHDGDTDTYIWTYGETPAIREESGMPPIDDIVPRLSYSSVESWDAVYNWYKDLAKEQYTIDEAIEEAVQRLTAGLTTQEEKIRALYHFVASQIRYVGIELGQGAYQPTPASQVLTTRYGDCKDKATLLISMLNLIGVEAFPALISPAPYERVDPDLPSLERFSHLIVAIPQFGDSRSKTGADGRYTWLDATSETCSFGDLPASDQGRKGFIIGNDGGVFVDIPRFPPESNRLIANMELALDENASVHGKMHISTSGQYNMESRLNYKQVHPSAWRDTFAAELSKQFPAVKVDEAAISDLNDLTVPVQIDIAFAADDYARRMDGRMLLPLPSDEFTDYAVLFAAAERTYPLDLSYPMQMEKDIRITIPDGWIALLPADLQMDGNFASMVRRYKLEGNVIRYTLHFTLKTSIIMPEDYATAKHFFETLAREDKTQLILEKT
ncbi:DUF3857 domain-containing protein [Candidatus Poribacteria bacterium]|nr:DUF3857 domain-containing protein [Candidatus Poribacteria bacterium]